MPNFYRLEEIRHFLFWYGDADCTDYIFLNRQMGLLLIQCQPVASSPYNCQEERTQPSQDCCSGCYYWPFLSRPSTIQLQL